MQESHWKVKHIEQAGGKWLVIVMGFTEANGGVTQVLVAHFHSRQKACSFYARLQLSHTP